MRAKLPVQLDNPFQRVRFLCLSVCWDSNGKQAKTITTKHVQVLTKPTRQTWNLACRFSKHGLRFRSKVDWELFIAHSQCLVKKNNNYLSDYYHSNSTLHFQPIPRNLSLSLSLAVCLMSTVQAVCVRIIQVQSVSNQQKQKSTVLVSSLSLTVQEKTKWRWR